jgi:CheY-like chemotaxis protein
MKKILLASQYKLLLNRYTNLLINWGFDIIATTSGVEALKLHKEHKFDVIVTDFELKEMSGCTLCSLIRQGDDSRDVPIILTCHNIAKRMERCKLSGADAIIIKPIERVKLLEVIGEHVGLQLIRGKRVALEVSVTIKKDGREFICFSRDISSTGMLLKSDYALDPGNLITCRFTLPDFGQLELDGEVVRYMTDLNCDNLYGVKFISIKSGYQKAISKYVDSCAKDNGSLAS